MDTLEVINTFNTGYKNLLCVSFHSDLEIWTSEGFTANNIKCFTINVNSITAIETKSGEYPTTCKIAVTSDGCVLYSDWKLGAVNKEVNGQIEEIIKLRGWIPGNLCVTLFGDILVEMYDDDKT